MRLMRYLSLLCVLFVAGCDESFDLPEVPFEKYVLDNGLEVVLHEDRCECGYPVPRRGQSRGARKHGIRTSV